MNSFTYDFFNPSTPSEYWRSGNQSTPKIFIREIPGIISDVFETIRCNEWGSEDFIAGIRTNVDKTCIFRIFDGGRDKRDRPHRWVLLVLEGNKADFEGIDLLEVVQNAEFERFKECAKAAEIIPPVIEFMQVRRPSTSGNSSTHELGGNKKFAGDTAGRQIREYSSALSYSQDFEGWLLVKKTADRIIGWGNAVTKVKTATFPQEKEQEQAIRPDTKTPAVTAEEKPENNSHEDANKKSTDKPADDASQRFLHENLINWQFIKALMADRKILWLIIVLLLVLHFLRSCTGDTTD